MTLSQKYNIANFAVDIVTQLGSTHAFTLTGGMAMYLNRAVSQQPKLTAIYCQHEQACVAAAEGYSKATNFRKAGFAVVTAGPGVSNTVTSLISAYGDSTPLIVLAGQIKTQDIDTFSTRTHGIQEIRSKELIEPCVKHFVRLDLENFRNQLIEACCHAFAGRPGPVFIEIQLDVQGLPLEISDDAIFDAVQAIQELLKDQQLKNSVNANLELAFLDLLKADRPLIYVGNGVRIAGQEEAMREFAERYQIPMVFSWLSFDILPGNHPLNFGCPGGLAPIYSNEILSRADTIVFLGARLDLGTTAFQRDLFGGQAKRWVVDVDAAELKKFEHAPQTFTVEEDLRNLSILLAKFSSEISKANKNWLPSCKDLRSAYQLEERQRLASDQFNVYAVAEVLSAVADEKVFVSASSGYAEETFTRFFVPGRNSRFFNGAALGAMGMGLPNALGASFGTTSPVMCIEADGGIMLNIQELATLSQYAPAGFTIFLLNNEGYESIRSSQTRHFGDVYGADASSGLFIPDFAEIAKAFKISYIRIDNRLDLNEFLNKRKTTGSPVLVDLRVEKFEYRGPSVKTTIDELGRPSTTPLGDISW
jgi:acetolactate synthase-1/2/3 large subunit